MIEHDTQMATQSTEPVVVKIRITLAPHCTGAGIICKGPPVDFIPVDTLGQNAHIEGGIVGNQQAAVHEGPDLFPEFRKGWLSLHCFRGDAGQSDVEIIEMGFRVN